MTEPTPPRRGRPPEAGAARIVVGLRVNAEERSAMQKAADRDGRPLAQWARRALVAAAAKRVRRRG